MNVGPGLRTRPPPPPSARPLVPAYSLIAVGPRSAGKSTLLRLLVDTAPISPHATSAQLDSLARFVRATAEPRFAECEVEVLWHGERVLLRLIDTPGLDFAEDDPDRGLRDIINLIEDRYVEGARDESTVGESHIHLCLYVLDPNSIVPRHPLPPPYAHHHNYRRTSSSSSSASDYSPPSSHADAHYSSHYPPSLPASELNAIRRLSTRVNVLPVLGRCDTVGVDRLTSLKRAVRRILADAGLGFGIFDEEGEAGVAPTALPVPDIDGEGGMHVEGQGQGHPLSWIRRVNGSAAANPSLSTTTQANSIARSISSPTAQTTLNADHGAPQGSPPPTSLQKLQEAPSTPEQPIDDHDAPHTPEQPAKEERDALTAQVKKEAPAPDTEMAAPTATATPPSTSPSPSHIPPPPQELAPESHERPSTPESSILRQSPASTGQKSKILSDVKSHSSSQTSTQYPTPTQQLSTSTPSHYSTSFAQPASSQNPSVPQKTLTLPLLPFAVFTPECYSPPHGSCAPRRLGRRELAAVYGGVAARNANAGAELAQRERMDAEVIIERVSKRGERDGNAMDVDEERTSSERSTEREHECEQSQRTGAEARSSVQQRDACQRSIDSEQGLEKEQEREDLAALASLFTRRYRWGVLDALDSRHSDFGALRRSVMRWRKELKTYTKDYLYERFKVESLLAAQRSVGPGAAPVGPATVGSVASGVPVTAHRSPSQAHIAHSTTGTSSHTVPHSQVPPHISATPHTVHTPQPHGSSLGALPSSSHPHAPQSLSLDPHTSQLGGPSPSHVPPPHVPSRGPSPGPAHIGGSHVLPPPPSVTPVTAPSSGIGVGVGPSPYAHVGHGHSAHAGGGGQHLPPVPGHGHGHVMSPPPPAPSHTHSSHGSHAHALGGVHGHTHTHTPHGHVAPTHAHTMSPPPPPPSAHPHSHSSHGHALSHAHSHAQALPHGHGHGHPLSPPPPPPHPHALPHSLPPHAHSLHQGPPQGQFTSQTQTHTTPTHPAQAPHASHPHGPHSHSPGLSHNHAHHSLNHTPGGHAHPQGHSPHQPHSPHQGLGHGASIHAQTLPQPPRHGHQHQLPPIVPSHPSHHAGSVHALLNHGHGTGTAAPQYREEEEEEGYKRSREQREREHDRERERERAREPPAVSVLGVENGASGAGVGAGVQGQLGVPLTVNGRKRKITMACNFCRSRKLKCDGLRPACAQCVKRSNNCDYQPHAHAVSHPPAPQLVKPAPQPSTEPVAPPSAPSKWYKRPGGTQAPQVDREREQREKEQREREREQREMREMREMERAREIEREREREREDVDELDDDGGSTDADGEGDVDSVMAPGVGGILSGRGGTGGGSGPSPGYTGRKRVSVDMLIAETLGDTGGAKARGGGAMVHNGERYGYGVHGPADNNVGGGQGRGTGAWYAETEGAGITSGMGVIDVGSEGDKRKRLNRQSANYGSKAVACVHCRARKTRCDAARPACGNCARRSLGCSYIHTQPSQPRSKGKKAAAAAAKEEAARLAAKSSGGDGDGTPSISTSHSPTRRHSPSGGSQHSGHGDWQQQHHGHHSTHVSQGAPRSHSYAHSHTHPMSRSPRPPPGSPIRVDDRLIEESAERDRPLTRSPAGPPIATLPTSGSSTSPPSPVSTSSHLKHDAPYMNGGPNGKGVFVNGHVMDAAKHDVRNKSVRSPDGTQSRSNSVGAVEVRKRKSPPGGDVDVERELVRELDRRPEKKRKGENISEDEGRMRV